MALSLLSPRIKNLTNIKSSLAGRNAAGFMFLFSISLLVPAFFFGCLVGWFYIRAEESRVLENARSAVITAAGAVDREVDTHRMVLQVLATSPSLQRGDMLAFYDRARNISRVLGTPIMLRPYDSQMVVVIRPDNAPDKASDAVRWHLAEWKSSERSALYTGRVAVSGLFPEPGAGKSTVAITVPVEVKGKTRYLLSALFSADDIQKILSRLNFKPGWIGSVVDADGFIVARTLEQDQYVGQMTTRAWREETKPSEGIWWGASLLGVPVVSAYTRSQETGWTTAVTVPVAILNSPVRNVLNLLLGGGVLLLAISAGVAVKSADYLSRALKSLVQIGVDPERYGDPSLPITRIREINTAARILRQSSHAAARREAQLRSILETIPNAMVTIDVAGTIRSFSRTAEEMFGYSAEEVVGRNVSLLMPEPEQDNHDAALQRYAETGIPKMIGSRQIVRGKKKDGTVFFHELHVGKATSNSEVLFIGFMSDQTDRFRAGSQQREAQKMEALGKLTGGVAHDFNNLLTVIKGNLEMLHEKVRGNARRMVSDAEEAVSIAGQLTASLLSFGRRAPLQPVDQEIGPLVTWTVELLRRTLGEMVEIDMDIAPGLFASIDGAQLRNAIINLALNARDAMPRGGRLAVTVKAIDVQDKPPGDRGLKKGPYVAISLTDTGVGMTPDVRERAIDPFFTTKPPGTGSGLGLSSVYGFARQSGGGLTIESQPGMGTCVTVYLPQVEEAAALPEQRSPPKRRISPRLTTRKILLVEDEERVRRLASGWLTRMGYAVVPASNGRQALALLSRHPDVDLVFTDVIMPGGLSGRDLAREIRARHPELPVLVTSGEVIPEDLKLSIENFHFIAKPYSRADLCRALAAAFDAVAKSD